MPQLSDSRFNAEKTESGGERPSTKQPGAFEHTPGWFPLSLTSVILRELATNRFESSLCLGRTSRLPEEVLHPRGQERPQQQ